VSAIANAVEVGQSCASCAGRIAGEAGAYRDLQELTCIAGRVRSLCHCVDAHLCGILQDGSIESSTEIDGAAHPVDREC